MNEMKNYIGVKQIKSRPMSRAEYNDYRGWELPEDENGKDQGFLVEYIEGGKSHGGKSNHLLHDGYISWSPLEIFNAAYRRTDELTFGLAIEALKLGHKVARAGWNGKDMYIMLQVGSTISQVDGSGGVALEIALTTDEPVNIGAHIDMKAADGSVVVGWLASQTDILSEDWVIL